MNSQQKFTLYAVAAPGLEQYTAMELQKLGLSSAPQSESHPDQYAGGVEFTGSIEAIYRSNLNLRTASRVLLRMGNFHAAAFSELKRHTQELPWSQYIRPGQNVAVRVTCHKSRLYHSTAVAREVIAGISAALGKPVIHASLDDEQPGAEVQLLIVRLASDHCTISIDTSGQLLNRRGYRLATAKAPLRETLAAGLLFASEWDGVSPIIDPFCGSGTIPIEAAMLANNMPPGLLRKFSFMEWPGYEPALMASILAFHQERITKQQLNEHGPTIFASDRDEGAIRIAQSNAERAGVAHLIEFSQRPISAIQPSGKGWIVTNPPYGIRISENKDLRNLYAQFGNVIRSKFPGWHTTVMSSDLALLHQLKIPLDTSLALINGGIKVRVGRGVVPDTQR